MKTKILADFQICISVPSSKKLFSSTINNVKFSVNSMKKENVSVEKKHNNITGTPSYFIKDTMKAYFY